jgi:hypothetical protein
VICLGHCSVALGIVRRFVIVFLHVDLSLFNGYALALMDINFGTWFR